MASQRPRSSSLPTRSRHSTTWPYEYSPLLNPRTIRLLFIESQDPTRHCITGRLEVVNLEDFERKYVALSYTWGPAIREGCSASEDPSRMIPSYELLVAKEPKNLSSDDFNLHYESKIRLENAGGISSIELTHNLSDYFKYHATWHINEEVPLWVDAICINQKDPAEVADQILLQADIYTMAKQTNVWLGACSKELSTLEWWQDTVYQALVGQSNRQRRSPYALDLMFKTGDHLDAQFWLQNFGLSPPNGLSWHDCWKSYVDFFFVRRWFSRLWTIQEVMLAKKVYMFCGPRCFNFNHVLHLDRWLLSSFFRAKPTHETKGSQTEQVWPRWNPGYIFEIIRTRINHVQLGGAFPPDANDEVSAVKLSYLLGVLQCARGQETTYARDKVLGLLGVATRFVPKDKVQLLVRNLGGSDRDVFISFARYYIHRQCLDILSYAGSRHGSAHSSWPSWVPNWDDVSQSGFYEFPSSAGDKPTEVHHTGRPSSHVANDSQSESLSACIPRVLGETLLLYGVRIGVIKEAYAKDDWIRHFISFLTILGCQYSLTGEPIEQALLGTIFRTSADESSATQRSNVGGDMDQFLLYIRKKLVCNAQVDSNFTQDLESLLSQISMDSRISTTIQDALSEIRMAKGEQATTDFQTDSNIDVGIQQSSTLRRSFSMEVEVMQKIFNIFVTDEGILGNGSKSIKPRDEIWVVKNGPVPLILERDVDGQKFRLVSTAYVHGVNFDELFRNKEAEDMVELQVT